MGNAKSFISNSYWDGAYSGLLSADRLIADLHAMEVAYLENDKNELEITRPISLKKLKSIFDPKKTVLQELTIGTECSFEINENAITAGLDCSFCRIRDVRIQVIAPSYPGIYLDSKLTLESNTLWAGDIEVQNRIGVKTMATSTANLDCGKFEFTFKNDKYSPFEGAGLDSKWKLLINDSDSFKKDFIEDIVIYISYSARNK